jgi:hypothetical protein
MSFPEPLAIRLRRLPSISSGLALSNGRHGVDDGFNPFTKASSLMSMSLMALPTPGIIAIRSFRLPMRLICSNCCLKSAKSNWFLRIFFPAFRLLFVKLRLGFFYQGGDITHAQDTLCHPLGIKHIQGIHLFAAADKLDGFINRVFDGKGAPPRVSPSSLVNTHR